MNRFASGRYGFDECRTDVREGEKMQWCMLYFNGKGKIDVESLTNG